MKRVKNIIHKVNKKSIYNDERGEKRYYENPNV